MQSCGITSSPTKLTCANVTADSTCTAYGYTTATGVNVMMPGLTLTPTSATSIDGVFTSAYVNITFTGTGDSVAVSCTI